MSFVRTLGLFVACCLSCVGCAEGLPGPDGFTTELELGSTPGKMIIDAGPPLPMTPMMNEMPAFMGTACERNTMMTCPCMNESGAMGMGTQRCLFEPKSPTMGALGPCERCVVQEPEVPDAGAAGSAGSAAGSGGAGGTTSAGSGGSEAGSGGTDGSAGSDDMEPECDPDDCPEERDLFGIPLQPCCTRRGECGSRSLLLGTCN